MANVKWKRCEACGRDSIPVERIETGEERAFVPAISEVEGVCTNRRCPSKWTAREQGDARRA